MSKYDVLLKKPGPSSSAVAVKSDLLIRVFFKVFFGSLILFATCLIFSSWIICYFDGYKLITFYDVKSDDEIVPEILKTSDHFLIAVTLLVTGASLIFVTCKIWPSDFDNTPKSREEAFASILSNITDAILHIDKLILSMATITLVLTFLVNILDEKHDPLWAARVLCLGFSISFVIISITIYLRFTHGIRKNS